MSPRSPSILLTCWVTPHPHVPVVHNVLQYCLSWALSTRRNGLVKCCRAAANNIPPRHSPTPQAAHTQNTPPLVLRMTAGYCPPLVPNPVLGDTLEQPTNYMHVHPAPHANLTFHHITSPTLPPPTSTPCTTTSHLLLQYPHHLLSILPNNTTTVPRRLHLRMVCSPFFTLHPHTWQVAPLARFTSLLRSILSSERRSCHARADSCSLTGVCLGWSTGEGAWGEAVAGNAEVVGCSELEALGGTELAKAPHPHTPLAPFLLLIYKIRSTPPTVLQNGIL